MTIYAVGDIQGCFDPLKRLLEKVIFDPQKDQLWSAGDIVNRGPNSLETLRFLKSLGPAFRMVLGNHDLHLLALAKGHRLPAKHDTLNEVMNAPDAAELCAWLQNQSLLITEQGYTLVHAGIPPQWSLVTAMEKAAKLENTLRSVKADEFFAQMYGNEPSCWNEHLPLSDQLRVITNYFTRMRFCDSAGKLELSCKLGPEDAPAGYKPWFTHRHRKTSREKIIFGHWAALGGRYCGARLFPLDTGCVWGKRLRILNITTGTYIHCSCK